MKRVAIGMQQLVRETIKETLAENCKAKGKP
jgi:hypothetical protein